MPGAVRVVDRIVDQGDCQAFRALRELIGK